MALFEVAASQSHLDTAPHVDLDRTVGMDHPGPDDGHASGIFGIVAGGISGVIVGFFIAGSFFTAIAAATGVVVGLVMGWYAARLTEQG
jgi:hypothetical protein